MEGHMSRRALQIVVGLLGIIPLAAGLLGLLAGVEDPRYGGGVPSLVVLDSNIRFHAGVWFGLGLTLYWLIPTIERQTVLFRALWAMILIGGIGRLVSMAMLGWPPARTVAFAALEIIGAPLFVWWQSRVAKDERRRDPRPELAATSETARVRLGGMP
jgi:hypothetical protein